MQDYAQMSLLEHNIINNGAHNITSTDVKEGLLRPCGVKLTPGIAYWRIKNTINDWQKQHHVPHVYRGSVSWQDGETSVIEQKDGKEDSRAIYQSCCEDREESQHVHGRYLVLGSTRLKYLVTQFMESEIVKKSKIGFSRTQN